MPASAVAAALARGVASAAGRFAASLGRGLSSIGKNIAGMQVKLAYKHDQLLRNWGASIIKHAEKFGVPKRFAREYVHRYMYPNLIGGPHGHRPHVRGDGRKPAQQIQTPGTAAQAAPSRGIRKPQTIYAAGPGAQHPPQQVAAESATPANVQFAAPAPVGKSYTSYVAAAEPSLVSSNVVPPPIEQPTNVEFASSDDSVHLELDFGHLANAADIDLAEGIGIGDITQSQLSQAAVSQQNTADLLDSSLTSGQGRATDLALSAGESESAQAMQAAEAGVEKPAVTERALEASARVGSAAKPKPSSMELKPTSSPQVSASRESKAPLGEVMAEISAQQASFSPIHVTTSNIPGVGVSRFHVSPPSSYATYTAAASGHTPQHIIFGPTRFEVT